MRSQRRLRLYVVTVVVFLLALAYFTTDSGGGIQSRHFYKSTVNAMNNAHSATLKKNSDAAAKDRSHIQRLDIDNNNGANGGARKQSTLSNDKQEKAAVVSNKVDNENDYEGISVAGRTKIPAPKPKDDQVPIVEKKPENLETTKSESVSPTTSEREHEHEHTALSQEEEEELARKEEEAKKEQEASEELDSILKRSPIIAFSKSYCPFSKKAKHILSQYSIVPAPYIVELDQHPLGSYIQKLLGTITGRRTVPNVMVNGLSIGGGDDIAALDQDDALISKIKSTGGKSIMEIKHVPKPEQKKESL